MIFLATWCPNCSWWLLPLLLGAWILGWLLWGAFRGGSYKKIIRELQDDLTDLRGQKNEVETDLAKASYEYEKVNSEKLGLFNQNKAWEEKYNQLSNTASTNTNTVTRVDTSGYQAKIAEQAAQLETYRKNNLLMETEFQGLKRRYSSLETQIDAEDGASTISDTSTDPTVDTSEYQTKITEQATQLETYRRNNLQLESEFQGLKERYADLESQLDTSNISSADTVSDSDIDATDYVAQIDDLKRQLEASHSANTQLKSDFSTMQLSFAEMETNLQATASTPTEDDNNRLSDLELQLSIVRNANAELEANYANLKSNFGEMELSLQAARNAKVDVVDVTAYDTRIEELKTQIEASEKDKLKLEKEYKKLKRKYDDTTIVPLVKEVPKKKIKKTTAPKAKPKAAKGDGDNLTKIEGIGPKIQGLLKESGILTWKQLSNTPTPKLRKILTDAGSRYKMHNPGTWAEQALFAAEGKWEELKKWQDELDGGK